MLVNKLFIHFALASMLSGMACSNSKQVEITETNRGNNTIDADTVINNLLELENVQNFSGKDELSTAFPKLITYLSRLVAYPADELRTIYVKAQSFKGDSAEDLNDKLKILTRMKFEVELLTEPKRFSWHLDDGTRPNDWLWPLASSGKNSFWRGRPINHTGIERAALDEFDYVKDRVEPRK